MYHALIFVRTYAKLTKSIQAPVVIDQLACRGRLITIHRSDYILIASECSGTRFNSGVKKSITVVL